MSGTGNKSISLFLILMIALLILGGSFLLIRVIYFYLPARRVAVVKSFSFSSEDALEEWDDKVLHRKVAYRIVSQNGESYVHAISNRSCSALYYKLKLDVSRRPFLSWKWRIADFPDKQSRDDLSSAEEDDFAARIYVIFPALFFANSKVLEYIWAEDLEAGKIGSSPYSNNIKLIVVESGVKEGDAWVTEERDIYEDYLEAFGSKPRMKIGSIAIMCDSDSTGTRAEAFFDEIEIYFKE